MRITDLPQRPLVRLTLAFQTVATVSSLSWPRVREPTGERQIGSRRRLLHAGLWAQTSLRVRRSSIGLGISSQLHSE